MSASAHILSPLSVGLFKRAILESGAMVGNKNFPILTKDIALEQSKQMAIYFNCSINNDKWLKCLRKIDPQLINNYTFIYASPIIDTEFLPLSAQMAFKNHKYIAGMLYS